MTPEKQWERQRHCHLLPMPALPGATWQREDYAFMADMVAGNHAGNVSEAINFLRDLVGRLRAGEEYDEGGALFEAFRRLHNATWGNLFKDENDMPHDREIADMDAGIVEVLLIATNSKSS